MTNLSDWQGKKPNPSWKPLNDTWFTTASMKRYGDDGSVLSTLTQGDDQREWSVGGVLTGLGAILFLGCAFFWPLLKLIWTAGAGP